MLDPDLCNKISHKRPDGIVRAMAILAQEAKLDSERVILTVDDKLVAVEFGAKLPARGPGFDEASRLAVESAIVRAWWLIEQSAGRQ